MKGIIGFIGSGNMAKAIIGGIIKSSLIPVQNIIASGIDTINLDNLTKDYGIKTTKNNLEVATLADIIFLAVKPNIYPEVIEEIKNSIKENAIIIIIAAGQTIKITEERFDKKVKIIRTMPNTPALVGEGMTAVCPNSLITEYELQNVQSIFKCLGKTEIVDENLMDVVTGVSGSSPAYVYMFIEAMADAAVSEGMPRTQAYKFAAQAVLGSAKMVLDTGIHPGQLKDNVCSAGGTTITAVCELEAKGMRNAVISAVRACTEKSKILSE